MDAVESGEEGPPFNEARYAEIVGKRAERYLPRFRRFAKGEVFSWNWAAFFGTLAWLRYRRLYRWSWLYFFVSTPMLIIWSLASIAGDACHAALSPATPLIGYATEALIAASWVLPPLFADRLYFNEVRRLAGDVKPIAPARSGAIIATLAVQVVVFVVALATLPSYADYTYRARVSEGLLSASSARSAVTEYVANHRRLPARLDEVAETGAAGAVARLEMLERGTIRAVFGGETRAPRLAGHTIDWIPAWKDDQIVAWACRSKDLPNVCVPASCRNQP